MSNVIAVVNQKGGVGKTTTCVNLAAALSKKSFRVLLIDLDPMGSMSGWLGLPENSVGMAELLAGEATFAGVIQTLDRLNMDFIGVGRNLSRLAATNFLTPHSLAGSLRDYTNAYDFVIIDSPPSADLLISNVLVASDSIIVPIQTEAMPLRSSIKFFGWLERFQREHGCSPRILGILPSRFDSRTRLSAEILKAMRESESLGPPIFRTVIRKNVRLAETPNAPKTIFNSASTSYGATDYTSLAAEVVERCGLETNGELETESLAQLQELECNSPENEEIQTCSCCESQDVLEKRCRARTAISADS